MVGSESGLSRVFGHSIGERAWSSFVVRGFSKEEDRHAVASPLSTPASVKTSRGKESSSTGLGSHARPLGSGSEKRLRGGFDSGLLKISSPAVSGFVRSAESSTLLLQLRSSRVVSAGLSDANEITKEIQKQRTRMLAVD